MVSMAIQNKIDNVKDLLKPDKKYILLFSGGLDSSCLLGIALEMNLNLKAYWIDNTINRAYTHEITTQFKKLGGKELNMLNHHLAGNVCANPADRCYYCKSNMLERIRDEKSILLDGSQADDVGSYRPGAKALKEFHVLSPLAEAGITKHDSVEIAQYYGADTHIAGLESCLATRFKYGYEITPDRIIAVRNVERFIISATEDYDVRCRLDGSEYIRIEFGKSESFMQISNPGFRKKIIALTNGLSMFITVDLMDSRPNEYDKYLNNGF